MKKGSDNLIVILMLVLGIFLVFFISFTSLDKKEIRFSAPEEPSCDVIERSACSETNGKYVVLGLSSETNAHAQDALMESNYPWVLCCNFGTGEVMNHICDATSSNIILRLFSKTNAHAEAPDKSPLIYGWNICYGNLNCSSTTETCPIGKQEILSLSSQTNAHVGDIGDYPIKICCGFGIFAPIIAEEEIFWGDANRRKIDFAKSNEIVYLVIARALTRNQAVTYKIFEQEQGTDLKVNETIYTVSQTDESNKYLSIPWKAKWIDDNDAASGIDNPEYYFTITINDLINSSLQYAGGGYNGLLHVNKSYCGDGIVQKPNDDNIIEECDETSGCSSNCIQTEAPILECADYESKIECEANTEDVGIYTEEWDAYQDLCQRRQNGTGCIWSNSASICNQKTEFNYNPDNPEVCIEVPVFCSYSSRTEGSCEEQDSYEIIYTPISENGQANSECEIAPKIVQCQKQLKLPFFGFFNLIVSLVIIEIIYVILLMRKKI